MLGTTFFWPVKISSRKSTMDHKICSLFMKSALPQCHSRKSSGITFQAAKELLVNYMVVTSPSTTHVCSDASWHGWMQRAKAVTIMNRTWSEIGCLNCFEDNVLGRLSGSKRLNFEKNLHHFELINCTLRLISGCLNQGGR